MSVNENDLMAMGGFGAIMLAWFLFLQWQVWRLQDLASDLKTRLYFAQLAIERLEKRH